MYRTIGRWNVLLFEINILPFKFCPFHWVWYNLEWSDVNFEHKRQFLFFYHVIGQIWRITISVQSVSCSKVFLCWGSFFPTILGFILPRSPEKKICLKIFPHQENDSSCHNLTVPMTPLQLLWLCCSFWLPWDLKSTHLRFNKGFYPSDSNEINYSWIWRIWLLLNAPISLGKVLWYPLSRRDIIRGKVISFNPSGPS